MTNLYFFKADLMQCAVKAAVKATNYKAVGTQYYCKACEKFHLAVYTQNSKGDLKHLFMLKMTEHCTKFQPEQLTLKTVA